MSTLDTRADPNIQTFGFLLLPGFALMSYAAAVEPLRAANFLAGRTLYQVRNFTPDGAPARASVDAVIPAEPPPTDARGLNTMFVCAGGAPSEWASRPAMACLRTLARAGVRIGGISGGPYVLAAAGLLSRHRFTIHWEHAPALVETFPDLAPERARFVIDGARITCGGGVAPLDLMHALITERMGAEFARRVSDWFLHAHVGAGAEPQRASIVERYGAHHPALAAALEQMETVLDAPADRRALAALAGVSPRHLDRLFATRLNTTVAAAHRRIRLDHAHRLLRESPLSIAEIAQATGFANASGFARAFRAQFNLPPSALRATGARKGATARA